MNPILLTQNNKERCLNSLQTTKIYAKDMKENKEKMMSKGNSTSIHNRLKQDMHTILLSLSGYFSLQNKGFSV